MRQAGLIRCKAHQGKSIDHPQLHGTSPFCSLFLYFPKLVPPKLHWTTHFPTSGSFPKYPINKSCTVHKHSSWASCNESHKQQGPSVCKVMDRSPSHWLTGWQLPRGSPQGVLFLHLDFGACPAALVPLCSFACVQTNLLSLQLL